MTLEHATTSGAVQKRNQQETFDMELNYTVFNPQKIYTCCAEKTAKRIKTNFKIFSEFLNL
jgi:hypothetical protein